MYNAGTIGDDEFNYLGRHVGGVVGRLGGTLEKAYNTGDIYNGYSVTGGVVGYWLSGSITNVFNTGNITVVNKDVHALNSLVGGLVGAVNVKPYDFKGQADGYYVKKLSYGYNLGTIRSFIPHDALKGEFSLLGGDTEERYNLNIVSGILGGATEFVEYTNNQDYSQTKTVEIDNVYTTGNIYAATVRTLK